MCAAEFEIKILASLTGLPSCVLCSAAVLNWGLLVLILYALYYMALEPFAGATWGIFLGIPMWLTATAFAQHVPYAWAWAIGLHILSWYLQASSDCFCQQPLQSLI